MKQLYVSLNKSNINIDWLKYVKNYRKIVRF